MYKLLGLLLVIGSLTLAAENKRSLEFEIENNNLERLEIFVTSDENLETYIIQKGDTLSKISKKLNISIKSLVKINNIININLIYVGDSLLYISEK